MMNERKFDAAGTLVSAVVLQGDSVVTSDGTGVQTGSRPATAAELADAQAQATAAAAETNGGTLRTRSRAALVNNRTYLAIAAPTNAQLAAQVNDLTKQNIRIIRLLLNELDATT